MCDLCGGSGVCEPCDGNGYTPSPDPSDDSPDCRVCFGSGICVECSGAGEPPTKTDQNNDTARDGVPSGVMT